MFQKDTYLPSEKESKSASFVAFSHGARGWSKDANAAVVQSIKSRNSDWQRGCMDPRERHKKAQIRQYLMHAQNTA